MNALFQGKNVEEPVIREVEEIQTSVLRLVEALCSEKYSCTCKFLFLNIVGV